MTKVTVTEPEFILMKQYIAKHCGISLVDGKEYLIESRLSNLVIESGAKSFQEFHLKAKNDLSGKLKDRIIDAMTTNETLWFRDDSAWRYLEQTAVPNLLDKAEKNQQVRVWSAASSTGQEIYSLLMLLADQAKARGKPDLLDKIEFLATDISSSALFLAITGRYDSFTMKRGMSEDKRKKYFKQDGNVWEFDSTLKKRVKFKRFNLQSSFSALSPFDLILCRYVTIYFSEAFKKELFNKFADVLLPDGVFLLGATESLRGYCDRFATLNYKDTIINTIREAKS